MSQQTVEAVRRSLELERAGERDAAMELLAPGVEWVVAREHPEARTIVGRDGVAAYFRTWEESMPGLGLHVDRILDAEETVVAIGSVGGVGLGSGAAVRVPLALVYRFDDAYVIRVEEYLDPAEALAAAGLAV